MALYTTILIEFLLIVSSILLLFKFRDKIGLAPLYILLGSVQYLQANLGSSFSFKVFGDFTIHPGSIILFSSVLFAVLLIYIKEGVTSARALIFGIVISNFVITLMFEIAYFQQIIYNPTINSNSIFNVNFKYFFSGTAILVLDFLLIILIYQYLISKVKKLHYFLILFISLLTVLVFDAIAFNVALFYGTPLFDTSIISHLVGKSVAALVFSMILYFYVKYLEHESKSKTSFIASQDRDVLSIFKYRKRYLNLKVEKALVDKKLQSQLNATLNNISDGFVTLDKNDVYTYLNKKASEISGNSPEAIIGRYIWDVFPNYEGFPFYKAYNKAKETQKTQYSQEYYAPIDKWIESRIYPSSEEMSIYFSDISERKKADEEIRMAHQRLTTHLNNSPLAIIEWDKNLIIRNWSEKAKNVFGWEDHEAVGKHFGDLNLVYEGDFDATSVIADELMNGKVKSNRIINRNYTKTNKIIYCEWYNSVLLSADGQIETIFSLVQDVTERKEMELAINESEEKFANAFRSNIMGLAIINNEKKFVEINDAILKILKKTRNEVLGKTIIEAGVFQSKDPFQQEYRALLWEEYNKEGRVTNMEVEMKLAAGDNLFVLISMEPFELKGESNVLITVNDITDRKEAELALMESENRMRTILDTEPECIKQLNSKGELIYMNPAGLAMIEAENFEMVKGQAVLNLIKPNYKYAFKKLTNDVFKGNSGNLNFEITGIKGTNRWLETHAVPLKDTEGTIISLLGITRDITERIHSENEIKEISEKMESAIKIGKIGYWSWDIVKDEVYWSDLMYEIYDVEKQTLLNYNSVLDYVHPDDKDFYQRITAERLKNKNKEPFEFRILRKDNSIRYVEAQFEIEEDSNEIAIKFRGTIVDVTERKKAENEHLEKSIQLQTLSDNLPDSLMYQVLRELDGQMNFTYVSKGIEWFTGKKAEEIMANPSILYNIIHEDDQQRLIEAEQVSFRELTTFNVEVRYFNSQGNVGWIHLRSEPRKLPDDRVLWDGVLTDITVRKKAEVVIKENEEKFSKAFQSNDIGKAILNQSKTIIEVNEALANIVGFKRENMLGKTAEEIGLFNFDDQKNLENEEKLWQEFSKKGYVSNVELQYQMQDKKELFMLISLQALRLNEEDHVMITVLDITDKKNVEAELEKHRDNLEELVKIRTEEINFKNNELQRMNNLFVGRELKMKELKDIIKELQAKNGNKI